MRVLPASIGPPQPTAVDHRRILFGTAYLIHADGKLHHSSHYIGFCTKGLASRIWYHQQGRGSPYLRALTEAGIYWQVVRVWKDVDRDFERRLKNLRNAPKLLCPVCRQEGRKTMHRHERIRNLLLKLQSSGMIQGWTRHNPDGRGTRWSVWTGSWTRVFRTAEVEAFLDGIYVARGGG